MKQLKNRTLRLTERAIKSIVRRSIKRLTEGVEGLHDTPNEMTGMFTSGGVPLGKTDKMILDNLNSALAGFLSVMDSSSAKNYSKKEKRLFEELLVKLRGSNAYLELGTWANLMNATYYLANDFNGSAFHEEEWDEGVDWDPSRPPRQDWVDSLKELGDALARLADWWIEWQFMEPEDFWMHPSLNSDVIEWLGVDRRWGRNAMQNMKSKAKPRQKFKYSY
jgi:hypothetical protein